MRSLIAFVTGVALAAACGSEESASSHASGGHDGGGVGGSTKDAAKDGVSSGGTAVSGGAAGTGGGGGSTSGGGGSTSGGGTTPNDAAEDVPIVTPDPVVFATADMVCGCDDYCNSSFNCKSASVAKLVAQISPKWLITAGDLQYESAKLSDFLGTTPSSCTSCPKPWGFDSQFGSLLSLIKPALGNHEYSGTLIDEYVRDNYYAYLDPNKTGSFGDWTQGYYAFDVPTSGEPWRIIVLNSGKCQTKDLSACSATSAQAKWLSAELADPAKKHKCTMAVFHHSYFSSGDARCQPYLDSLYPFWKLLHDGGADVIVSGHDHIYERFYAQDEHGVKDDATGISEFIVGVGGRDTAYAKTGIETCTTRVFDGGSDKSPNRNSAIHVSSTGVNNDMSPCPSTGCDGQIFGGVAFTLHPDGYTYQFRRTPDSNVSAFADEQPHTVACH